MDTRGRAAMLARNAMSSAPQLSVILVNLNGGSHLATAVASAREQRFVQPELIVIDRGSTDESRAWLEAHRGDLAVEQADAAGHFAAANQGIALARGEWVFLLGVRDRLVGDMILSECLNWMKKTEAGVVAGEAATDDGRLMKLRSNVNPVAGDFLPRSATFYRRTLFAENGGFDASLETMAGYDLHVRLWKSRIRFKPIPLRISACHRPPRFTWKVWAEEFRTRHRYFPAWRCAPWDVASALRAAAGATRSRSN